MVMEKYNKDKLFNKIIYELVHLKVICIPYYLFYIFFLPELEYTSKPVGKLSYISIRIV